MPLTLRSKNITRDDPRTRSRGENSVKDRGKTEDEEKRPTVDFMVVFLNRLLMFKSKTEDVSGDWGKFRGEELHDL
jgi:hypothetical protein